jgi:hypothetical protein
MSNDDIESIRQDVKGLKSTLFKGVIIPLIVVAVIAVSSSLMDARAQSVQMENIENQLKTLKESLWTEKLEKQYQSAHDREHKGLDRRLDRIDDKLDEILRVLPKGEPGR